MNRKTTDDFTGALKGNNKLKLPFLLSVVLCGGVFKIYYIPLPIFAVMLLIAACECWFIFLGGDLFIKKGFRGKLYITLFVVVVTAFCISILKSSRNIFVENFFFADETSGTNLRFLFILLSIIPAFFGITVYYFGCVNYRMAYLMLVSLMSCVLYVKNIQEVDNFFIALIVLLNLMIFAEHNYWEREDNFFVGRNGGHRKALVTFVCILVLGVSLIPKQNEARYYDKFRRFFMNNNITSSLGMDYSNLSTTSGNADGYENIKNRRMYTLWSDVHMYLKRQVFDYYDFEKDNWYADEGQNEDTYSMEEWGEQNQWASIVALQTAMKRTAEYDPAFAEKYGVDNIISETNLRDRIKQAYMQSHNFSAAYYLAPPRCVSIFAEENHGPVALQNGSFYGENGMHGKNTTYQIMYYEDFKPRQQWIAAGGADFDISRSGKMLSEMVTTLFDNDDPFWRVAGIFNVKNNEAVIYNFNCKENNSHISPEIKALAEKITADCTYDYEKAEALQNYFHDNNYEYDMEYVAEDTSPEYFLFESKKGTCSDFASAYVLMARAVGLTVRYVEGFVPERTMVENTYAVTDATAHAYPEVYIQNFGWTVYEPTVASPYNSFGSDGIDFSFGNFNTDLSLFGAVGAVVLAIIVCSFFVNVMLPYVNEKRFMHTVEKSEPSSAVVLLHKRLAEQNVWGIISDGKSLTPYEMAEKIKALTDFEVHNMAFLTEKVVYEQLTATATDKREALALYETLKKAVRKYKKMDMHSRKKSDI